MGWNSAKHLTAVFFIHAWIIFVANLKSYERVIKKCLIKLKLFLELNLDNLNISINIISMHRFYVDILNWCNIFELKTFLSMLDMGKPKILHYHDQHTCHVNLACLAKVNFISVEKKSLIQWFDFLYWDEKLVFQKSLFMDEFQRNKKSAF